MYYTYISPIYISSPEQNTLFFLLSRFPLIWVPDSKCFSIICSRARYQQCPLFGAISKSTLALSRPSPGNWRLNFHGLAVPWLLRANAPFVIDDNVIVHYEAFFSLPYNISLGILCGAFFCLLVQFVFWIFANPIIIPLSYFTLIRSNFSQYVMTFK